MLRTDQRIRYSASHDALPYQAEAVDATVDLDYAALFHEQGLGKTKMALDLALRWLTSGTVDSVLVVTKKSLVDNWERESLFHTSLRPVILTQDRQSNFYAFNRPGRLYLAHYEVMYSERGRLQLFAKARRLGVILDESQRIKNPSTKASVALHNLAPLLTKRIIMTGTTRRQSTLRHLVADLFPRPRSIAGYLVPIVQIRDGPDQRPWNQPRATSTFENGLAQIFQKIRPFLHQRNESQRRDPAAHKVCQEHDGRIGASPS